MTFKKWLYRIAPILIVAYIVILTIIFMMTKYFDSRPEKDMAHSFLVTNSVVNEYFGAPIGAVYRPADTVARYYPSSKEFSGQYYFTVNGIRTNGVARVSWWSRATNDFHVDSVVLVGASKEYKLWPLDGP